MKHQIGISLRRFPTAAVAVDKIKHPCLSGRADDLRIEESAIELQKIEHIGMNIARSPCDLILHQIAALSLGNARHVSEGRGGRTVHAERLKNPLPNILPIALFCDLFDDHSEKHIVRIAVLHF